MNKTVPIIIAALVISIVAARYFANRTASTKIEQHSLL